MPATEQSSQKFAKVGSKKSHCVFNNNSEVPEACSQNTKDKTDRVHGSLHNDLLRTF